MLETGNLGESWFWAQSYKCRYQRTQTPDEHLTNTWRLYISLLYFRCRTTGMIQVSRAGTKLGSKILWPCLWEEEDFGRGINEQLVLWAQLYVKMSTRFWTVNPLLFKYICWSRVFSHDTWRYELRGHSAQHRIFVVRWTIALVCIFCWYPRGTCEGLPGQIAARKCSWILQRMSWWRDTK